jgi:hypothetical protein
LNWLETQSFNYRSVSLPAVKAIPISFLLGAIIPTVVGMWPTWYHRSPIMHQRILAVWQPDPLWVAGIQLVAKHIFAYFQNSKVSDDAAEISRWVKKSYLMAAICSALGHTYVILMISFSTDPSLEFKRMYWPRFFTGPKGTEDNMLVNGPWLFLQYDFIIIALSSLSWAYILVLKTVKDLNQMHMVKLALFFALGTCILGAGTTVSLALYWREHERIKIIIKKTDKDKGDFEKEVKRS